MATCRQRNCTFMQICFQTPEKKSDVIREISVKRNMRHDFIDSFRQIDRFLISRKVKTNRPRRLSRCFPCFSKKEKEKKRRKIGRIDKNHHIHARKQIFENRSLLIDSDQRETIVLLYSTGRHLSCFVVKTKLLRLSFERKKKLKEKAEQNEG